MAHRRRLVLALGNPLVGEDGFGAAVVDALRQRPDVLGGAELRDVGTDLLSEMDTLADYDEVVLIDAVIGGGPPGDVAVVDESVFSEWSDSSPGCHEISPLLAVKMFRLLHPRSATHIRLIALHTDELCFGAGVPEPAVAAAVACLENLP